MYCRCDTEEALGRYLRLHIVKSVTASAAPINFTRGNPQSSSNHLIQQNDGGTVVHPAKIWANSQMGCTYLVSCLTEAYFKKRRSLNLRRKALLTLFFLWKEIQLLLQTGYTRLPLSPVFKRSKGLYGDLLIINTNRRFHSFIWYCPFDPKFKSPSLCWLLI